MNQHEAVVKKGGNIYKCRPQGVRLDGGCQPCPQLSYLGRVFGCIAAPVKKNSASCPSSRCSFSQAASAHVCFFCGSILPICNLPRLHRLFFKAALSSAHLGGINPPGCRRWGGQVKFKHLTIGEIHNTSVDALFFLQAPPKLTKS